MSEQKYTLTLYIAPPGGKRVNEKGQPLTDSGPGHVYFAIQKTGEDKKAYGFSPTQQVSLKSLWQNRGIDLPGHAVPDEHKIYANPAYMRTMEISKEQYEKLKAFGDASLDENHASKVAQLTQGKFSTEKYNVLDNSCVDYVFHALRYSGIYNHQTVSITSELNEYGEMIHKLSDDDGKLNVLHNAKIFNQIPLKTVGTVYDRTEEELKKARVYYQVGELNNPVISPKAQQLAQQCEEKLIALCKEKGITADSPQDYRNIAMALAAKAVESKMSRVEKMDIGDNMTVHIVSFEPHAKLASVAANDVVNIPVSQSMAQIQQTEQQFAQQAQERQWAQSQQQSYGRSIT